MSDDISISYLQWLFISKSIESRFFLSTKFKNVNFKYCFCFIVFFLLINREIKGF